MENIKKPRGTEDILFEESNKWRTLEAIIRQTVSKYHFDEIRTPIFESTSLFVRGVGETSDVVSKEMFSFEDRKGRSMTLRPEGTAGSMRAYIEHKMYGNDKQPVKLYYMGPMFRYERPQKGRQRQFHQFGIETIGIKSPQVDVETILLGLDICNELSLKNVKVLINTLGDKESRLRYRDILVAYFSNYKEDLCGDCLNRLEKNPLRLLDCKVDGKKDFVLNAPLLKDYLTDEASIYFNEVLNILDSLKITYEIDNRLVRGLDYYTDTIFEVVSLNKESGAQATLFGGGRYDGLVASLGGPDVSGVGFGMGLERMLISASVENPMLFTKDNLDVFIKPMNALYNTYAFKILEELRNNGYKVDMDYLNKSMKSTFNYCSKNNVSKLIIIGEDEFKNNGLTLKDLDTKDQVSFGSDYLQLIKERI